MNRLKLSKLSEFLSSSGSEFQTVVYRTAVMSVNLCWLNIYRVSHKKTVETLETEVKKLQSLLSSEKQLRFVCLPVWQRY